jgi:pimeloyl-ACP methyl ester carboxylesterase
MKLGSPWVLRRHFLFPGLMLGHGLILRNVFVDGPDRNPYVRHFHREALRDESGFKHLREFARVSETICRDALRLDFSWRLRELRIPVLTVWGDQDKLTALPLVRRSLGHIPDARLRIIDRCGHLAMIERPRQVSAAIRDFLAERGV